MPDAQDKILVFIPMYRCATQIGRVLRKVYDYAQGFVDQIIVVDNRSPDTSCEAALRAMGDAPVIPTVLVINSENYSLGGSHKVAFQYALDHAFTHVIALHGDDQGDIRDFLPHLIAGTHRVVDAMLGARFIAGAELYGYGGFRKFGNAVFNLLFSLAARQRIYDMGSGINLYSIKVIAAQDYRKAADDLTFHCYFLLCMISRQRILKFVPVSWREEDQVSNAKLFRQSGKILRLLLAYRLQRRWLLDSDHSTPGAAYTCVVAERK